MSRFASGAGGLRRIRSKHCKRHKSRSSGERPFVATSRPTHFKTLRILLLLLINDTQPEEDLFRLLEVCLFRMREKRTGQPHSQFSDPRDEGRKGGSTHLHPCGGPRRTLLRHCRASRIDRIGFRCRTIVLGPTGEEIGRNTWKG